MKHIVSAVPGRIRVRDSHLRDGARHAGLGAELAALEGVSSVEGNIVTGSFLLRYDAAQVPHPVMEARVSTAVAAALDLPPVAAQEEASGRRTLRRWQRDRRLNTWAKYGMLGSLGASLALAAAGSKKAHAATGALFLGLLGIHMAVHRRHLFK
ncbi:hypothetical protein AZOA_06700 [Azoarcus sp. Aa7]|nr:hypothetical protein [Azoarcus sp. Aa7]